MILIKQEIKLFKLNVSTQDETNSVKIMFTWMHMAYVLLLPIVRVYFKAD